MPGAASPRVFISYARSDGETFATALRRRLEAEEPEITVWQDHAALEGGIGWWKQIEEALDKVTFLVIVMTPAAMTSENTRLEWRCARQKGVVVYPVMGPSWTKLDSDAMPSWMRKAQAFNLDKEWETFTNFLKSDRQPVRVPFMAPDLPNGFVPRPRELDAVLALVLDRTQRNPISITTTLQGAGGYGKTTLAKALCHDDRVIETFDDGILWVTLGQTPNVLGELVKVYEALTGEQGGFVDVEHGARRLAEKLEHRTCLLVIDDVWDAAQAAPFLRGGDQCARIITTRKLDVESRAERVLVDEMSRAESVAVLATAFDGPVPTSVPLEPLARRLGEWPLLLRLAAGMLRKRLARGDSLEGAVVYVGRALDKHGVTAFDRAEASERDKAVALTVAASRNLLSPQDRRRLVELSIFPEEADVPLTTLSRLWGLDALDTEECAQRLDDVALVTLDLRTATIALHDVMRAFLMRELDDVPRVHAALADAYGDPLRLPDAYAWRWLPYHLAQAGQIERVRSLLLDPVWLRAKLAVTDAHALVRDFDNVSSDPDLATIQKALRLSMHVLTSDGDQLAEQLCGRLGRDASDAIERFCGDLDRLGPKPRLHAAWANLQGPESALVHTLRGHEGRVEGVIVLPDGRGLSWSDDGTLRVWDLATATAQVLKGHEGGVRYARLLPDGRVLSWSDDRTLRVWDLATASAQVLAGHSAPVTHAQVLPDGRVLSCSGHDLRVWDLPAGTAQVLETHGPLWGADALPDGRVLSRSAYGPLHVWDLATGGVQVLEGHESGVHDVQVLPDGRVLSWDDDRTLRVWNLAAGTAQVLAGHDARVAGSTVLPDGRVLALSDDRTLRIWDLFKGTAQVFAKHEADIIGVQVLPDGRLLSWNDDHTLRIWDLASGAVQVLVGHEARIRGAQVLPDGQVLSWSMDRTLHVWDLVAGTAQVLAGHEADVNGADVLPDGRLLSWSDDSTLRVWDLTAATAPAFTGHEDRVLDAQLLTGGRVLSWSKDRTLRVWHLASGTASVFAGHEADVNGAQVLPDGRLLSWSHDHTLRVWDLATSTAQLLAGHERSVEGAQVLSDGRVLSWSDDHTLRVWDMVTGTAQLLAGHERWGMGAQALPDGRVLSWSHDHTLRVWDLATSTAQLLAGHEGWVLGAQVLSDGRVLSWSGDGTLRVWDLATGTAQVLAGHEGGVGGARVLPGGQVLSWGGDHTLRAWDLATGTAQVLAGHEDTVVSAQVLPGGRVVSWSGDRTLRVWDLTAGTAQVVAGHEGEVAGAQLLPDGRVLSWSVDRTLRVWDLNRLAQMGRYDFDATPTAAVVCPDGYFVGDALGRVHFLKWLTA